MNFAEMNIGEFVEKLASHRPTPGGGSIAGLSACLAASLLLMVIGLTKKDNYELNQYRLELEKIKDESLELINEDADVFEGVIAAYKLPKETEDNKTKRHSQIQLALKDASIVPLKTMKTGLKLLELGQRVIKKSNPNVISDVGVAGLMALSAIKGGYYNVIINVQSLVDYDYAQTLRNEAKDILEKAEILEQEIDSITKNDIIK